MLHKFILFSVYLAVLTDCSSATCRAGDFSCTNDKCIPVIWKCDKEDDCGDNSDEENCDNAGCHVGEFSCKNDKCIPYKWQCDKEDDCGDGSDEENENCGVSVCSQEEFSCRNGRCINATLRCNTENDCGDNSDEEECDAVCTAGFIGCSNGHCIPVPWQCDGTFDCPDKSDEENCTFTIKEECDKHSEFDCGKNKCIPIGLVCNKENDCGESEDEPSDKCFVNECLLNNGECPQLCVDDNYGFHCDCHDGYHLDGNGSCIASTIKGECDKDTQFDCGNNTCIPIELVCNKENDCGESEDEPSEKCFVNECLLNNGGCPQLCVDDNYGFHCVCHDGYHLDGNGSCISSTIKEECDKDTEFDCGNNTCIPIGLVCNKENDCGESEDESSDKCFVNECILNNGGCPQLCVDDNYGFHCECRDGYHLDSNGSCIVKRESLLFKNESDLLILDIETGEKKTIFSGLGMPIALDYDFENDVIVWGDTKNKSIHRLDILNGTSLFDANSSYVDTVVMDKVDIEGLAVDWIYGNVYWTDRTEKSINVATLDGNMTTVLFKNNISKPRAIAVNPLEGWLFWTDWGRNPKIERAGMDGTHRSIIISENITWPNGLAIDYETKRLFWTDGRLHSLSSSEYDGSNVQVILSSRSLVSRAFAIDVFQDSLYWNEWTTKSIKRVNKFNGKNFEIVVSKLYFPGALKVYHPLKQPKGINYCINTNSSCSHFCLPAPQVTLESVKFTCFCPAGMILAHDGRVCRTVE